MTRDVKRDFSAEVGLEPAGYSESSSIELRFWVRTSFWSWMRRACWIAVSRRRRSTSDLGAGRPVGRVGMVFCVFLRIDLGGADVDAMGYNGGVSVREIFSKTKILPCIFRSSKVCLTSLSYCALVLELSMYVISDLCNLSMYGRSTDTRQACVIMVSRLWRMRKREGCSADG